MKKFLLKHVGNMGDFVFFIPPVLATLKKKYPNCHITLVTAWGFKDKRQGWGKRNQGGFSINLSMTNPHVDQIIHWHDTKVSPEGKICIEEGISFPTWNREYFNQQKNSGKYDGVYELDFGMSSTANPIQELYKKLDLPEENYSEYKLHFSEKDEQVAQQAVQHLPKPRIVLLEGIESPTTRGWILDKAKKLEKKIKNKYGVAPVWFGGRHIPEHFGRGLTLRENIATLKYFDVGIGVMSGPMHFAAAVGLPTISLYCDQPLHRAAPAYFLNRYITDESKKHRTLLGPSPEKVTFLKSPKAPTVLTNQELAKQNYSNWHHPGEQSTKSCLAAIDVDEVMSVLNDTISI